MTDLAEGQIRNVRYSIPYFSFGKIYSIIYVLRFSEGKSSL